MDRQLVAAGRENATCSRLIAAPGYGLILSSAMAAMVVNPQAWAHICRKRRLYRRSSPAKIVSTAVFMS
jgi:hypothetical protein